MSDRPKAQVVTKRKGRGFPGLLGNALTPLSKAQDGPAASANQSSGKNNNTAGRPWSRKFSISSSSNSSSSNKDKPSVPKALDEKSEEKDSSDFATTPTASSTPSSEPSSATATDGSAEKAPSAGQHGTVEICIVDGLNLPLEPGQQAYWLVDYDSEFSTTPCATYSDEGKPEWNATSTQSVCPYTFPLWQYPKTEDTDQWYAFGVDSNSDVALVGGKVMLYLYLVGSQHEQTLLGTAQIRLGDRLQDGKSETHWVSYSSKSSDELATGSVRVTTTYRKPKSSRIGPRDFMINKVLGKGSFGTVYEVRKKESGRSYAMKVLSKPEIAKRNMSPHVLSERKILQLTHLAAASPFLVCLKFSFQTRNHLYLVMDLKRGGELFSHLQREGGRLSEDRVRFYAAEIILALQMLHENKVVYRDLKPENILLDEAGHICLCDFGLAKLLEHKTKTKTFCGTAEYLPPEMIESDAGYDYLVDWWSLGCMIFELICGFTPFYSEDNMDKFAKIVKADLRIPKRGFSPVVTDLIERLLCRDPKSRLGARGAEEIKAHPFFDPIDWKVLAEKRVEPPFKPEIDDDPGHEMEFDEDGPPAALLPFVHKSKSSEDRRRHQSKWSSREPASILDEPEEHGDHWWRDFTFAQQTTSSRASLASVAPGAVVQQQDGQSATHEGSRTTDANADGLYKVFDEPVHTPKNLTSAEASA